MHDAPDSSMRIPFVAKLTALVVGVACAVLIIANLTFFLTGRRALIRGVGVEAVRLAEEAARAAQLHTLAVAHLDQPSQQKVWRELVLRLQQIQTQLGPRGVENVYVLAMRGGELYVVADPSGDDRAFAARDTIYRELKLASLRDAVPRWTPRPYSDAWGTWLSGYAPARSADRSMALIGVDLPLGALPLMSDIVVRNVLFSLVPAVVIALLSALVFSRLLVRPVSGLTAALRELKGGRLGKTIEVKSNDEIGEMAVAFNEMSSGLAEKERLRAAFSQAVSPEVAEQMLRGGVSLGGEIREVTVLFADVRGFTALAEAMAARSTIAMLNELFSALLPIVTTHGGVVDKLVGDEIFAVFGAPLDLPNDALAAVRVAVEMRAELQTLNAARKLAGEPELHVGIGINTGAVVAGGVGSADRQNYTVIGSTVNTAARLCSAATPDQILISQSTFLRVRHAITARALEPMELKGISYPLAVFEVLGLKETAHA